MDLLNGVQTGSPECFKHQVIDLQNDYVDGKLTITSSVIYANTNADVDVNFEDLITTGLSESIGSTTFYHIFNISTTNSITFKMLGNTMFTIPHSGKQYLTVRIDDAESPPIFYT